VLCEVPESVIAVIRSVPEVRSHVPIAESCEAARASLAVGSMLRTRERQTGRQHGVPTKPRLVLAPILPGMSSVREVIGLAEALSHASPRTRDSHTGAAWIHLAYIIVVPRALALNAPLGEAEDEACRLIAETESLARSCHVEIKAEIARTRDTGDEVVDLAKRLEASKIVLVVPRDLFEDDLSKQMIRTIMQKAPCEVVLKR
jgi:hypothetical protein